MARYLNPSALAAVRSIAEDRLRWRRPRRAARVRPFAPDLHATVTGPGLDVLRSVLVGLQRLDVAR